MSEEYVDRFGNTLYVRFVPDDTPEVTASDEEEESVTDSMCSLCDEEGSTIETTAEDETLLDGGAGYVVDEFAFSEIGLSNSVYFVTLSKVPADAASLVVSVGTGAMVPSTDYEVTGQVVRLLFTPESDVSLVVRYLAAEI